MLPWWTTGGVRYGSPCCTCSASLSDGGSKVMYATKNEAADGLETSLVYCRCKLAGKVLGVSF